MKCRKVLGVATLSALVAFGAAAGEETYYTEARILCPVRLLVPARKSQGKTPLLVALHGRGGSGDGYLGISDVLKEPRPVLVAPDGPYPLLVTKDKTVLGRSWDFPSRDRKLWAVADPLVLRYILDVVAEAARRESTGSVYLLGHSQGAAYAYLTALNHSDKVKGVIAIGGVFPGFGLNEEAMKQASKKVKIFIAQGKQDLAVGPEAGKRARDLLEKYGFMAVYREYEGGHELSAEILREAQAWMMKCEEP